MDSAAWLRALRCVLSAGRLPSWLSKTTIIGFCWPDEGVLPCLVLSLEKLGTAAGVEPAAVRAAAADPAIAAVSEIATPAVPARVHNRAVCMLDLPLRECAAGCRLVGKYVPDFSGGQRRTQWAIQEHLVAISSQRRDRFC